MIDKDYRKLGVALVDLSTSCVSISQFNYTLVPVMSYQYWYLSHLADCLSTEQIVHLRDFGSCIISDLTDDKPSGLSTTVVLLSVF